MKFFKQRCAYSCGPIAIMNVCKALKLPVKYKDINFYRDLVNCTNEGTYSNDMIYGLCQLFYSKIVKKVDFDNDSILIIEYCRHPGWHYTVVFKEKRNKWRVINGEYQRRGKRAKTVLNDKEIKHWLSREVKCIVVKEVL